MKLKLISITLMFIALFASAQGTFVYDQESTTIVEGAGGWSQQPMGQSFTPTLSSIDFVDLYVFDSDLFHNSGSTLFVNIRGSSITGPILGTSSTMFTPDSFSGIATFTFSSSVALVPGVTYFLQPVQSGDNVSSVATSGYPGGTAFGSGIAFSSYDLWFREGIMVVPEPSSALLFVMGGGLFILRRRKQRNT